MGKRASGCRALGGRERQGREREVGCSPLVVSVLFGEGEVATNAVTKKKYALQSRVIQ